MSRGHRRRPAQTAPARKILLDVSEVRIMDPHALVMLWQLRDFGSRERLRMCLAWPDLEPSVSIARWPHHLACWSGIVLQRICCACFCSFDGLISSVVRLR